MIFNGFDISDRFNFSTGLRIIKQTLIKHGDLNSRGKFFELTTIMSSYCEYDENLLQNPLILTVQKRHVKIWRKIVTEKLTVSIFNICSLEAFTHEKTASWKTENGIDRVTNKRNESSHLVDDNECKTFNDRFPNNTT